MDKKLPFLSINPTTWKLLCKGIVVAALLFFIFISRAHAFSFILFGGAMLFFYFSGISRSPKKITSSFWICACVSASILVFLSGSAIPFAGYKAAAISLLFGFAAYLLLGVAEFSFKNPNFWYEIIHTLLILAGSSLLFFMRESYGLWITSGLLFIGVWLLFRELLVFYGVLGTKRLLALGFGTAFVSVELFNILSFLPTNFVSNGAILALFLLTVKDIMLSYYGGFMNLRSVFQKTSIFIIVLLVILAFSRFRL